MSITIEGKEYEIIRNKLYFGASNMDITDGYLVLRPLQQPTFSVGMRVENITYPWQHIFTKEMVYRIAGKSDGKFYLINNDGSDTSVSENDMSTYFTPYEKPKEGEKCWYIDGTEDTSIDEYDWSNNSLDNNLWNLGLAFKTKEQATFARERLSKLF